MTNDDQQPTDAPEREPATGTALEAVREAAASLGLHHGRMITGSKSGYRRHNPANEFFANASLCDEAGHDLWWGDLDLTLEEDKLLDLAAAVGLTLFVMAESSMVNHRLGTPLLPARDAVLVLHPDRTSSQPEGSTWHLFRDADGRFARPPADPAS